MLPKHLMVSECDGHMYDTRRNLWHKQPPLRLNYAKIKRENLDSIAIRAAIRQAYSWPGGYEIVLFTSDGGCLCPKCARKEYHQIAWSVRHECDDGWRVVAADSSANYDELTCDHCGRVIVGDEE